MKKAIIQFLCFLFPNRMVNMAYNKLANPQILKLRAHEITILEQAEKRTYRFNGGNIQTYAWNQEKGKEKILLIHGWEGQAGNFSDLIPRLVAKNYIVYAFDAPAHGFSTKKETSPFEFSDWVGVFLNETGATKLVSHSFGGVATTYALSKQTDLAIEKYALLTTPDKFLDRIQEVSDRIGISQKVRKKLLNRIHTETQLDLSLLSVSEIVKKINVQKALIIHDKNDRVAPISYSRNVANNWPNCDFVEIEGTGHFRILRTDFVLDKVIDFLNEE